MDIELEICPCCRGTGMMIHEGGWNVQVECLDCGSHTTYVEYNSDEEKAEAEKTVARLWKTEEFSYVSLTVTVCFNSSR